jgi:hypothetical protein
MASIERTAYPRFKRTVSDRELHESFTPSPEEIAWACDNTRTPEHELALVVLLNHVNVNVHDHGSHFIPWENPHAWVNDLRRTFHGRRP